MQSKLKARRGTFGAGVEPDVIAWLLCCLDLSRLPVRPLGSLVIKVQWDPAYGRGSRASEGNCTQPALHWQHDFCAGPCERLVLEIKKSKTRNRKAATGSIMSKSLVIVESPTKVKTLKVSWVRI
jgi:hypothetical protein